MVDTNSDPNQVDYPIPANDDATKSISIVTASIAESIKTGLTKRKADKEEMDKEIAENKARAEKKAAAEKAEKKEAVAKKESPAKKAAKPAEKPAAVAKETPAKEPEKKAAAAEEKAPAKKAEKATAKPDDLKKIEGIGPKISEILTAGGIATYADLAAAKPEAIKEILLGGRR